MELVEHALRIIVTLSFVVFVGAVLMDRLTFSFSDPSRRYRYIRRFHNGEGYEIRGSGYFKGQVVRVISGLPRYEGEPTRQVVDSRTGEVLYDNTKDLNLDE